MEPPTHIRKLRKRHGMTLEELSDEMGMTAGNLSRLERGLIPYTQETLEKAGKLFGCEPGALLGGTLPINADLELNGSDHAMVRVVEDLIILLDKDGVIRLNDLPEPVRDLLDRRQQLRTVRGGDND